jgi:hypothetical protein
MKLIWADQAIEAQVQAFQISAERLQAVLDAQGFSEQDLDEVVAEFDVVRKKARATKLDQKILSRRS